VNGKLDADKCSIRYGYRLQGKARSKRSISMTSMKSLETRCYRLKRGHVLTGMYQELFGHPENDKCWWCGSRILLTWEHLFHPSSCCRDHEKPLWKMVGKTTGWIVARCRHMQSSELSSMELCDRIVRDFLEPSEVGKFPPNLAEVPRT